MRALRQSTDPHSTSARGLSGVAPASSKSEVCLFAPKMGPAVRFPARRAKCACLRGSLTTISHFPNLLTLQLNNTNVSGSVVRRDQPGVKFHASSSTHTNKHTPSCGGTVTTQM